ncbi:hypothetical protein BS50DRAFT_21367 [Corynespora cassiicola Philippines]|uniref:Uncharacterized protein n=1 Tax=Corynespora cassiicola Philippines TaxID=1448308 RepID=A0A2T2PAV6_CORCC|nr:hypothetical protein BS50DRAFT_21367 [Corynespora cassiicola Philippines]
MKIAAEWQSHDTHLVHKASKAMMFKNTEATIDDGVSVPPALSGSNLSPADSCTSANHSRASDPSLRPWSDASPRPRCLRQTYVSSTREPARVRLGVQRNGWALELEVQVPRHLRQWEGRGGQRARLMAAQACQKKTPGSDLVLLRPWYNAPFSTTHRACRCWSVWCSCMVQRAAYQRSGIGDWVRPEDAMAPCSAAGPLGGVAGRSHDRSS